MYYTYSPSQIVPFSLNLQGSQVIKTVKMQDIINCLMDKLLGEKAPNEYEYKL